MYDSLACLTGSQPDAEVHRDSEDPRLRRGRALQSRPRPHRHAHLRLSDLRVRDDRRAGDRVLPDLPSGQRGGLPAAFSEGSDEGLALCVASRSQAARLYRPGRLRFPHRQGGFATPR